ncbi:hypothetical protein [Tundra vole stool-associated circular virus]|nr:hypothetical protein [Tundra vole stool-associated circular virus]
MNFLVSMTYNYIYSDDYVDIVSYIPLDTPPPLDISLNLFHCYILSYSENYNAVVIANFP